MFPGFTGGDVFRSPSSPAVNSRSAACPLGVTCNHLQRVMWCIRGGGQAERSAAQRRQVRGFVSFSDHLTTLRKRAPTELGLDLAVTSLTLGFLDHPYRKGTYAFSCSGNGWLEMTKGSNLMGIIHPNLCIEIYPIKTHNRVVQFPTKACMLCGMWIPFYHRLLILK